MPIAQSKKSKHAPKRGSGHNLNQVNLAKEKPPAPFETGGIVSWPADGGRPQVTGMKLRYAARSSRALTGCPLLKKLV